MSGVYGLLQLAILFIISRLFACFAGKTRFHSNAVSRDWVENTLLSIPIRGQLTEQAVNILFQQICLNRVVSGDGGFELVQQDGNARRYYDALFLRRRSFALPAC